MARRPSGGRRVTPPNPVSDIETRVTTLETTGGGGGRVYDITDEIPIGTINGLNTDFITEFPFINGATKVTIDDIELTRGVTYLESGNTSIQIPVAPTAGSVIKVSYDLKDSGLTYDNALGNLKADVV